jgi:N utilization substance protein A
MSELAGEKIDIIEWSEDPKGFIADALSPAKVLSVSIDDATHQATVTVTDDQQSLAIGRGGQNVRLAAKLTGWKIDIKSVGGTGDAAPTTAKKAKKESDNETLNESSNTTAATPENTETAD